jgi:hypothetical protein
MCYDTYYPAVKFVTRGGIFPTKIVTRSGEDVS